MSTPRFANILLAGRCNQACVDCIGRKLGRPMPPNLDRFPLAGLDRFVAWVRSAGITEISLTGLDTDPQLYRYQRPLIARLRAEIAGVRLSLHTNGRLTLAQIDTFNAYDRATVSLASFVPATCLAMTGRRRPLDLAAILTKARIPVKLSVLVTPANRAEIEAIVSRSAALGVRRMVLRRRYGDRGRDELLAGEHRVGEFAGNPVYAVAGMEVTVWDFERTRLSCLNLYSDGSIDEEYELARNRSSRCAA